MECSIENCPLNAKVDNNTTTLTDHEGRLRRQEENNTDIAVMKTDITHIKETGDSNARTLKELKERPGKRWDILVAALISGGGMYIISQMIG